MVPQRKALVFVRRLASLATLSLLALSTTALAAPGEGRLSRDLREARAAGQSKFGTIVTRAARPRWTTWRRGTACG